MDSPRGRIIELDTDASPPAAVVEVVSAMRCARCAAGKGCGAGVLDGDPRPRRIDARIRDKLDLDVGDQVRVSLSPNDLLQAALTAYGAPLAGAVTFAAIAYLSGFGDLAATVTTLIGLVVGIGVGRWRLRRNACLQRFTPVVTERLGPR